MSYRPDALHEWTIKRLVDGVFNLEAGIRRAEHEGNERMLALLRARRLELLNELNRRVR